VVPVAQSRMIDSLGDYYGKQLGPSAGTKIKDVASPESLLPSFPVLRKYRFRLCHGPGARCRRRHHPVISAAVAIGNIRSDETLTLTRRRVWELNTRHSRKLGVNRYGHPGGNHFQHSVVSLTPREPRSTSRDPRSLTVCGTGNFTSATICTARPIPSNAAAVAQQTKEFPTRDDQEIISRRSQCLDQLSRTFFSSSSFSTTAWLCSWSLAL
jgi:hypothetical protein